MPDLDALLNAGKGGAPAAAPKAAPSGGGLDRLLSASTKAPSPVAPSIPSRPTLTPSTPPPAAPAKKPGLISRALSGASKAIAGLVAPPPEDQKPHSTLEYLPSELARHLPLGVGEVIKQIQEDPETAAKITPMDVVKEVPGAVGSTAAGFAKAALSYPLTFYGAASRYINPRLGLPAAPGASDTGAVNLKLPLLGETPNLQKRVEQGVESGYLRTQDKDLLQALETGAKVAGYTGEELLNGLFTASLANIPFAPRPTTIAKTPGPIEGVTVKNPPQSFRLYEPPVGVKPIAPEVVQKLIDDGVPVKSFDPKLPTYFKLTGTQAGGATGELVQLKPSYFDQFVNLFKSDINKVPPQGLISLGEVTKPQPGSVEQAIEQADGFKPGDKVKFDTALFHKDAATVKAMLPNIPPEYQARFAKEIAALVPPAPAAPAPQPFVPPVINLPGNVAPVTPVPPETPPVVAPGPNSLANIPPTATPPPIPAQPKVTITEGIAPGTVPAERATTPPEVERVLVRAGVGNEFVPISEVLPENVPKAIQETKNDIAEGRARQDLEYVRKATEKLALLEEVAQTQKSTPNIPKPKDLKKPRIEKAVAEAKATPPEPQKGKTLSVKPEVIKKEEVVKKRGPVGNLPVRHIKIGEEEHPVPEQLVTKTGLKDILAAAKKDAIDFKVIKKDGVLYMEHVSDTGKTLIRPSALGLVEAKIEPGDTIRVTRDMLKEPGTSLRGVNAAGEVSAAHGGAKMDTFENRIGGEGKATPEDFKLFKKVEELVRKYAQRVGEGYLPRGAAGVFYHATENIRLQGMNDLSVAAHEITHRLDFINKISEDLMKVVGHSVDGKPLYEKATAPLRKEMTKMYETNYPGGNHDHPLKKRMVEGYATLLQKYVEAPKTTAQNYPNIVREMLRPGGKYYKPVIGEIISDLEKIVTDYQSLSALDKVGARVTSDHNATGKESFLTPEEHVRTEIADEVYPIEKLATQAGMEMTKEDPSLWIRQYNNISSVFGANTVGKKGYWNYQDGEFVKRLPKNWGDLLKNLEKKQIFDMFNHYLVARDQHFNFVELDAMKANFDRLTEAVNEVGPAEAQMTFNEMGVSLWDEWRQAKADYQRQKEIMDANGMDAQVVKDAYLQNRDRFKEEEELYDALVREDLKFLNEKDIGIVSDEEYAKLTAKEGYASLKRQFFDDIVGDESVPRKGVAGARPSSLKQRTGSSRAIIAPVYNGIKNHAEVLRKGLKQVVYNKIVGVALQGKHPALFQRQQIIRVKDPNTGKILYPQDKDPNIVMGRVNGKRVAFLTDAYIRKTLDEILTYQNVSLFEKMLSGASRFFTKGTTGLFPGFTVTNYTIDQITALAQTQNNYLPIYSPLKELMKAIQQKNTPEARFLEEYLVLGGERQTFVGWQDLSPREMAQKIAHERQGLLKIVDVLNQGMDVLAIPSKYSEIATRAVEYIKSRKAGRPQVVSLEQAGRVTAPFHHIGRLGGGRVGKSFIRSIPFFNPLLQVFEQTYRSGFKSGPRAQQRMLWVLLALTAANVAAFNLTNALGTKDQKELYKDLEPDELSGYIWLPNVDGKTLIKLRMPNQLNQFGTLVNMATADQIMSTKYTAGDYVTAGTSFLPNQFNVLRPAELIYSWLPQLVKPAVMISTNTKDFPSVRPLESQSQQRKEPGQRSTPSTPYVTKKVGEALNLSPIKLDALITGYFGRATGFLTGKPGVLNPFSTLVRQPYFESGRRLQKFYDLKTVNDEQYNTVRNNPGALTGTEIGEILKKRSQLNAIDAAVSAYRDIPEDDTTRLSNLRDTILEQIDKL